MNKTDDYGEPCGYVEIETYPHSLAECTEEQRQYIFDCIPMQELGKTVGFKNMYYYAYNSFGNAIDMINGLYNFIQLVKQQTGKDKVNIIPISMGGAIFNNSTLTLTDTSFTNNTSPRLPTTCTALFSLFPHSRVRL